MRPAQSTFENGWAARTLPSLRRKLLAWFDRHQRRLPWRADRDPYRIWVSEVMLQQTTVAAVVPYFTRFLEAFPSVAALADADEQAVLKLWEGLGYYRRARHLHAAAKVLAARPAGLPDDPAVWGELPGVGRYILGAVLSQAFDRRLPIVETNSLRVLARLFGYRGDPREGEGKKWVWAAAEAVLPRGRVGAFNQALMELGALICTPAAPKCADCPLASACRARRDGLQNLIPPRREMPIIEQVEEVGVAIWKGPSVLLCRRPENSRWANLWEFPHERRNAGEDVAQAAARIAKDLTGLDVAFQEELLTVRHGVTRWSITLLCVSATLRRGPFASRFYTEGRWVEVAELSNFPVSSPQRKLMKELASPSDNNVCFNGNW